MENYFANRTSAKGSSILDERAKFNALVAKPGHRPFRNKADKQKENAEQDTSTETIYEDADDSFRVQTVSEGSVIQRIVITCPSGKVLHIDCQYTEEPADGR